MEISSSQSTGPPKLKHISNLSKEQLELLPKILTFPESDGHLCVEINGLCNACCGFCLSYSSKSMISLSSMKRLAVEFKKYGVQSVEISGGEPTLNPDYIEIIAMLNDIGIRPTLTTNAIDLTKSDLDRLKSYLRWITISLHSSDPTIHNQLMQRDTAFENVKRILNYCEVIGLDVQIHTVVSKKTIFGLLPLHNFLCTVPSVKSWKLMKFSARARGALNFAQYEISPTMYDMACGEILASQTKALQINTTKNSNFKNATSIVHNSGALLMLAGHNTVSVGSLISHSVDYIANELLHYGVHMEFPCYKEVN